MTGVAILGSTGSIGVSTLKVLERHPDRFDVVALTAHGSKDALENQAAATRARYMGLVKPDSGWENGGNGALRRGTGPECLLEAATDPDVDIVVNAVVGATGTRATLAALAAGKRVALANKETLVMAGDLVMAAAAENGEIVPVDSEHSAVLQCVTGRAPEVFSRLILTASGGPFREWDAARVENATVDQALKHPTWSMGPKITVDSATLANKALEVIEAHYLFGLDYDSIDVVVHPQSIIHAFAEFVDGSILAQMGYPSMELPILYALTHPERLVDDGVARFDPVAGGSLTFEELRHDVFRTFDLGVAAGRQGGAAPAVFNAANEVAVQAFLDSKIKFGQISHIISNVLDAFDGTEARDIEARLEVDAWARREAAAAW
jgi:1-deoxy-D-xylulose-5-phosphate reductoisomerase